MEFNLVLKYQKTLKLFKYLISLMHIYIYTYIHTRKLLIIFKSINKPCINVRRRNGVYKIK